MGSTIKCIVFIRPARQRVRFESVATVTGARLHTLAGLERPEQGEMNELSLLPSTLDAHHDGREEESRRPSFYFENSTNN